MYGPVKYLNILNVKRLVGHTFGVETKIRKILGM